MPHTYIERKRSTGLPHFLSSVSRHARTQANRPEWLSLSHQHGNAVAAAPQRRSGARGGGVGHDNDIDDDDGELTFLLYGVE